MTDWLGKMNKTNVIMNQTPLKCKINSDEGDAALLAVTFPSLWTAWEGIWNSSAKSLRPAAFSTDFQTSVGPVNDFSLQYYWEKIEATRISKSWCLPFITDKMNVMSFVFFPSHWSPSKMQLCFSPLSQPLLTHGIYSFCLLVHTFFYMLGHSNIT